MHRRPDGIVDFDKRACIGCKACMAACPYDAIFINPEDHSAEKCNLCAHRLEVGLEPACVVVCPTEAILVGDLDDPSSRVARLVQRDVVTVRRPEKQTRPRLFYKGAHQATLDPLAAARPPGGLFLWSEQGAQPGGGAPANGAAPAVLAYDLPRRVPWDARVSLYTWTKGLAAGGYLVPLLLVLIGRLSPSSPLWRLGAPLLGGLFLALTGAILILDLEHPARFGYILRRPQWQSWLARGAFIILGYSLVLAAHFVAALAGRDDVLVWLGLAGGPLAAMTAIYTAFLFGQARGRDLWQSPLLPPHLLLQSLLAGAAATLLVSRALGEPVGAWTLALASLAHLALVWGEASMTHPTAHAQLAAREMTSGRHALAFRAGVVLCAVGLLAPWLGALAAAAALAGLLLHEHAHVQAGQSVPLA
jgi:formate-dependent nitrite reductase membrane component NrfD/ferredoxin